MNVAAKFRVWIPYAEVMATVKSLEFKADGIRYINTLYPVPRQSSVASYMSNKISRLAGDKGILLQYTGHKSIDSQEVFNGDLLRFPDQKEIYEVRYDNEEGSWGIYYKDMNAFKIGMTRFMVVAGNVFEDKDLINMKETK